MLRQTIEDGNQNKNGSTPQLQASNDARNVVNELLVMIAIASGSKRESLLKTWMISAENTFMAET